ncbi:MAG TPA: hypothetical protein PKI14_04010 [Fervidobacterium sp.]|nr:hypothetical protein [Fervidobacterium sp.]HPT54261.1 hypothetical protein [Fervidobacterium sp.]HPZ17295.1 hypothetical protein [Fervidobacterium sp.]HQE48366.1 hypothetical protein [Fervidobacterium sp.]HUM42097.1 hypothetical protein [Fervidobacterium sp.]
MRRTRLITLVLLLTMMLSISQIAEAITIEKTYVGIKYSFRNFRTNGEVIFIDPFGKKMAVYELATKQIMAFYNYIGNFVTSVYDFKNSYIIVDRTGPSISKVSLAGEALKTVKFERRIQGSVINDGKVYVLLEGGQFYAYDSELKQVASGKFAGSPAYIYAWNGKVFGTYIWNDSYDIEFIGEEPQDIGLTTPSILNENLLIDTRGGQVYNLETKKVIKLSPYLSSSYFDGQSYFVSSMSNSTVYVLDGEKVLWSFRVPYTPTSVSKIGENIVVLSSSNNKVMVTTDGKNIETYPTGEYPIEIFKLNNGFAVYCSDSGEIYYYYF